MPPTKRPKISIYISEEQKEVLESWAKSETRTVSNLVSHLIEKGINEYTLLEDKNKTTQQLASNKEGELQGFLKLLTSDKPPSDPDLIELAHNLGLDVKLLISLRDRLFPTRRKQPNEHK